MLDGHLAERAADDALVAHGYDLDFPAVATCGARGDVLARLDAADDDMVCLFIGEGEGDNIALWHVALHEKARYRHTDSHSAGSIRAYCSAINVVL